MAPPTEKAARPPAGASIRTVSVSPAPRVSSAGETDTTDDFVDAWYVGYTSRMCTSVWVGHPEGRRSLVGVHGLEEPNGETLPMDIWSAYMVRATEGDFALDFPQADASGLEITSAGDDAGF